MASGLCRCLRVEISNTSAKFLIKRTHNETWTSVQPLWSDVLKEFTVVMDIPEGQDDIVINIIGKDIEFLMQKNFTWFQDVRWGIPYDPRLALMIEPS